jgi:7-cyano-7-deazaguanine synthase
MRTILLLSGGIDSFAAGQAAVLEGSEIYAVSFDYGQINRQELAAAIRVGEALGVRDHRTMKLDLDLGRYGRSSLLAGGVGGPGDFGHYVPARHAIFLSCALGFAEVVEAQAIVMGAAGFATATRRSAHRDCQPEFFAAFQRLADVALDIGGGISVICPLMEMPKRDIIAYAISEGLDLGLTWTCHGGGDQQCGECRTCRLRLQAFHALGAVDPVPYAQGFAHWIEVYSDAWGAEAGDHTPALVRPDWRHFH